MVENLVALPRAPLPDKKYFKIGEVADLVGVEPHVLRYWETQFPQIRPHKARSGHRLYRRREVEILLVIRELLHVQRFTIAGARQALRTGISLPAISSSPHRPSADFAESGEEVEVDVEALAEPELARALEGQAQEGREVVEVEVRAQCEDEEGASRVSGRHEGALGERRQSPVRRALLEAALAEATAILAVLDREEAEVSPLRRGRGRGG